MRGFKLASLNVTSIIKHIDELRVLLVDHSIDVLAINETRLDSTINDNEVHISGYEIVRRDRSVNGRFGGGVCFYVRCNINFLPRFDMSIDQLENLCIEIRKPRSKPFLVTTWYRPPDSPVDKFNYFETLVGRLDAENVEYYFITNILAGRWVRDWTHRGWLEVSRTYRAKRGGFGKLPATRGASNPGLTEPASMFGFYHMPFR